MLKMPPGPPVSETHSTSTCSTMMPNAIVTMARYGPETRSAAAPTAAPTIAAATTPTGTESQSGQPRPVAASAAP